MRTEDDLCTALTALEHHAPAAARVLPGSKRTSSRRLRSPRTVRWLAVTGTAAAMAGLVTTLILPAASPASPATDAMLQAKLLAAFSAARGDIVHASSTALSTGDSPITVDTWTYPSQPRPGQLVRSRTVTANLSGTLHYDETDIFVMPATGTGFSPDGIAVTGERIIVDYVGKTKSDQRSTPLPGVIDPNNSARIAFDIKALHWTVRTTTLNGRAALELSFKQLEDGNWWITYLWVDAATYLPLRETDTFGPRGERTASTENYEYLPATQATLANLTQPMPAGFKWVTERFTGPTPIDPGEKVSQKAAGKVVPAPKG